MREAGPPCLAPSGYCRRHTSKRRCYKQILKIKLKMPAELPDPSTPSGEAADEEAFSDENELEVLFGRTVALHAALELLGYATPQVFPLPTAATVEAMRRRLGSSISRMSLMQREDFRENVMQLVSRRKTQVASDSSISPTARKVEAKTYRQIIAFLQPHLLIT